MDIKLGVARLEFQCVVVDDQWHCVFATAGPWSVRLLSKSLIRSLIDETFFNLKKKDVTQKDIDFNYVPILARLVDLIHPTHQLQATVLAYPLFATNILKRRLVSLGYELGNQEDGFQVDYKFSLDLVRQLQRKAERDMRAYYEFSVPVKAEWIVGLISSTKVSISTQVGYAGQDSYGFGFGSNGSIYMRGVEYKYIDYPERGETHIHRNIGMLVDLYLGTIQLVIDETIYPPAFGKGANLFSNLEQQRQKSLITKQQIIPMFSIKNNGNETPYGKARMSVNFGTKPFQFQINATPLNQIHIQFPTKSNFFIT
jgi:hypothetical protein